MEEPSHLQVSAQALEATQEAANTKLPHTVSAQCARETEVRVSVSAHYPPHPSHSRCCCRRPIGGCGATLILRATVPVHIGAPVNWQ